MTSRRAIDPICWVLGVCATGALALAPSCGDVASGSNGPNARELGDGYAEVETVIHAPVEVPVGSPTVLFLGDSLAAGLHLSPSDAFPAVLQRRLATGGHPFFLSNAGVSGDTSAGGLARLEYLLKNVNPDVVVVELGANDGLRGVKLANTEDNLRAILRRIQAAGARPLLLGMNVPTNLGPYAKDFAAIYPRLAKELDVPLVPSLLDGVGGRPELNLRDGMHPTPEGHERLADNVEALLRGRLTE